MTDSHVTLSTQTISSKESNDSKSPNPTSDRVCIAFIRTRFFEKILRWNETKIAAFELRWCDIWWKDLRKTIFLLKNEKSLFFWLNIGIWSILESCVELLMAVSQDLELQPYEEAVRIHMEYPAVPEISVFWKLSADIFVCWFYI